MTAPHEVEEIRRRYARRDRVAEAARDDPLNPANWLYRQEKERAFVRWIRWAGLEPVSRVRLLEVGCGSGGNLLQFLRLGFRPENLAGNDLLEDEIRAAQALLPAAVALRAGDASALEVREPFDVVFQSTVFTSILDDAFQQTLADRMWALARPGGGVLWYDFTFDNPWNRDVRGVPVRRVRALFPRASRVKVWRVGLAPPIRRGLARIHPALCGPLSLLPFLRTHVLCWLAKPA